MGVGKIPGQRDRKYLIRHYHLKKKYYSERNKICACCNKGYDLGSCITGAINTLRPVAHPDVVAFAFQSHTHNMGRVVSTYQVPANAIITNDAAVIIIFFLNNFESILC